MAAGARVGLIVNPIAGMGGRVGLKGTDGEAYYEAVRRGARPVAPLRAAEFLRALPAGLRLLVPNGVMGEEEAREHGAHLEVEVVRCASEAWPTTAEDTRRCAAAMADRVAILAFVGGDGTARDVVSAVDERVPVIGVPAGVKMYSAVFAQTPRDAALAVAEYLAGGLGLVRAEVLDIDEGAFRAGRLSVRHYGYALVPGSPRVVTSGKEAMQYDEEELRSIARYVVDNMVDGALYILGPGSTVAAIAAELGFPKTLLGVDAVTKEGVVGLDLDERGLLEAVRRYGRAYIVLSPIGGQGFILGRGNQQISPAVVRAVGVGNIIIVATKSKLRDLRVLRVDTGDPELDELLRGYRRVVVGYGEEMVVKVV